MTSISLLARAEACRNPLGSELEVVGKSTDPVRDRSPGFEIVFGLDGYENLKFILWSFETVVPIKRIGLPGFC